MNKGFDTFENLSDNSYIYAKNSKPLFGRVIAGGAKNMVTKVLAAFLIAGEGKFIVKNTPLIGEVLITLKILEQLGVKYSISSDKNLEINIKNLKNNNIDFLSPISNRISILMAGPILKHFGRAVIHRPGGCKIGERKIDFHIKGLKAFGIDIEDDNKYLKMRVKKGGLRGIKFKLPFPSVGATENLIITAACAKGESIISNCAIEPEIIELIKLLQRAGIEIIINEERTVNIRGDCNNLNFSEVTIIPDRVEVISFASAALATKGDIFVKGANQDHIVTTLGILEKIGSGIEIQDDGIRFYYKQPLKQISVRTEIYPGFATDFQQPLAVLLSQVSGKSFIHETIFEDRFGYLTELNKIIQKNKFIIRDHCPTNNKCRFIDKNYKHIAHINGPIQYGQGEVVIQDLRAGFTLLIAGILSHGLKIKNLNLLFRGYEDPVGKLKSLGANINVFY